MSLVGVACVLISGVALVLGAPWEWAIYVALLAIWAQLVDNKEK